MLHKQMLKNIIVFLLIAVLTALAVVSCGGENEETQRPDQADNPGENGDDTEEDDAGDSAEVRILPDLEDTDWGGYVFTVLTNDWDGNGDWRDWRPRDIFAEEQTGNPLNDAVYNRNATLEGRYNFTIVQLIQDEAGSFARRVIQAGDTAFDSAALTMNNTIELAQNGMWVDLNTVRNIDLEKPWWDQGANYGMSIGGKLFLTSGDFNLVSRDACPGLLFNKQLLANFQLEDPYALARAGQWTLGKLYEMTRDGGADLNGDGLMEWEVDRFGLITQRDAVIAFLHGAGGRFTAKDSNDMPEWVFGNDRTFAVMDSVFDVMLNEENVFNMHWAPEPIYPKSEMMFQEDRGLFMWVRLRIVENLRGMETDFGIMPMPWFDETQGTWHHTVNRYTGHAMAIPMFHDDDELDRTGFILEAISAESKYTVIPAYYDVQLSTQIARDEESSDMLDIIFSTTVWDTGEIYNWADFSGNLLNLIHTRNRNLASLWDRSEDRVQTMMQRTLDKYEELD